MAQPSEGNDGVGATLSTMTTVMAALVNTLNQISSVMAEAARGQQARQADPFVGAQLSPGVAGVGAMPGMGLGMGMFTGLTAEMDKLKQNAASLSATMDSATLNIEDFTDAVQKAAAQLRETEDESQGKGAPAGGEGAKGATEGPRPDAKGAPDMDMMAKLLGAMLPMAAQDAKDKGVPDEDKPGSEKEKRLKEEERERRRKPRKEGLFERMGKTATTATTAFGGVVGAMFGGLRGAQAGGAVGTAAGGPAGAAVGGGIGAAAGAAGGAKKGMEIGGAVGKGLSFLGRGIDMAVGAVESFTSTLLKTAFIANSFVNAFNPALVQLFNSTIKDMVAVIGAGLQPITTALTQVFRALADTLVPLVQELTPVFQSLGDALIQFLVPVFQAVTQVIAGLVPDLAEFADKLQEFAGQAGQLLASLVKAVEPIVRTLMDVFGPVIDLLGGFADLLTPFVDIITSLLNVLGGLVSAIMDYVGPALSIVSDGLSLLGEGLAYIASLFEMLADGILNLIDMIAHPWDRFFGNETEYQRKQRERSDAKEKARFGQTGASIGAAAQPAQYMAVEDLSKNLIKAAFSGSGNDRLNQIATNTGKQVALLEQIAAKGDKAVKVNVVGAGGDFGKGD